MVVRIYCIKQKKINLFKALGYCALVTDLETKISSEIEFIKKIVRENEYLLDIVAVSI